MAFRQRDLNDLYLDRTNHVAQRVAANTPQSVWHFVNQPSVIITALLIAVTCLCNAYIPSSTFSEIAYATGQRLWASLITIIPAPLLFAIDNWLDPQMVGTQTKTHASKSAAMRRVLGLDRSRGIVASVFQARSRALSLTENALGLKVDTERPAGLGNRDNSCFQNSILQGLASLDTLPDYLATCLRNVEKDDDDVDSAVTQTLRSLLSDLNNATNNGRTLWTPSKLRMLSTWTQQDAQEYFSKILDDIDKAAVKALEASKRHSGFESDSSGKDDTAASQHSDDSGYSSQSGFNKASDTASFRNPLEGLLAQRVSCVQCGHSDGLSMIPFNCLTLSLGLRRQHDLYERLDSYSTLESIEGVECPKCTLLKAHRLLNKLVTQMREKGTPDQQLTEPLRRLEAVELALEEDHFDEKTLTEECKISSQGKVTTTKTKQIVIARPPQSLAIHVNRSVFDPSTFDMIKNSAPVDFPMTLDLGPWCLGSAESANGTGEPGEREAEALGDGEQWLQDPTASMIAGDERPSKLSGPVYELRAVVTHYGRHENGHYICYRRHPRNTPSTSRQSSEKPEGNDPGDVDDVPDEHIPLENIGEEKDDSTEQEMDWWRLSDHNVSKVDPETVASLAPGVFMLFYDCIDPSMVLRESDETEASESLATQVNSKLESQTKTETEQEKQSEAGEAEAQMVDAKESTTEATSAARAESTTETEATVEGESAAEVKASPRSSN